MTVILPSADKSEEAWQRFLAENDRALPRPVPFAWQPQGSQADGLYYDLILSTDAGFTENVTAIRGLRTTRTEVYNLLLGTRYYWKVAAWRESRSGAPGQALGESKAAQFVTHAAPPRWISVPGVTNMRDIGGWSLPGGRRVRQGMIYRGSEMNSHCAITDEGRRVMLEDLGIRTDLDLRGAGEDCAPVLDLKQVEYINIPILAYDSIACPEYTGRYRALFHLLSQRALYPIFMHCWGGADRTGTAAFLIQALLGVSEADLCADYELTSLSIWGERLCHAEAFQDMLQTLELFTAKGSSLQTQVERYLRVIGVTPAEIDTIKEILMD